MKLIVVLTIFLALPFAYAASFDGGIQGRVLNAQGVPVEGATIIVTADNGEPRAKAVTATDGVFAISNLEPGLYTVTVSLANTQQELRRDVIVS